MVNNEFTKSGTFLFPLRFGDVGRAEVAAVHSRFDRQNADD